MKRSLICEILISLAVFAVVFGVYITSGNNVPFDSRWSIHTAMSIIREGNTDLDEYRELAEPREEYQNSLETVDGHLYTIYPIGASLLAVPFVFVLDRGFELSVAFDLNTYVAHTIPAEIEALVASVYVALTAVIFYWIARRFLKRPASLLVVFIFAFCTPAWSTASRALWQHGPSMLLLATALLIIVYAKDHAQRIQYASIPLAASVVVRPVNIVSAALLTLFVFTEHRRHFGRFLLWALPVAALFTAYNLSVYHSLLPGYYLGASRGSNDFSVSTLPEALVGHWFSPARGLLVFSPVLVFSVAGLIFKLRRQRFERLDLFLIEAVVAQWIVMSVWPIWWGGWSFGPRLMSDVVPYLVYWIIPALEWIGTLVGWRRTAGIVTLLATIAVSFFIHYRGANAFDTIDDWNRHPANIDTRSGRLWDWRDIQFLRGLKWGVPAHVSASGVPIKQLDPDTYLRLGTNDLRVRKFEAGTSFIAPSGESWLILADGMSNAPELAFVTEGAALADRTRTFTDRIPYRVYRDDFGARILTTAQRAEQVAAWAVDIVPDSTTVLPVTLPAAFGQSAELLAFEVVTDGLSSRVTVTTYWRAGEALAPPQKLFVHALNAQAQIVGQRDGFDAPMRDWSPGDLIVQVSQMTVPPDSGPIWIEAGLFNPDTGSRLPVTVGLETVTDRLLLERVEIESR